LCNEPEYRQAGSRDAESAFYFYLLVTPTLTCRPRVP
jgi:hypothetical protein